MKLSKNIGRGKTNSHGFTLIEIMTVLIIIGIITAVAIPNFVKAYERSLSRKARLDLIAIHSAEQIYKARYGYYAGSGSTIWQDIDYINLTLFDANHKIKNDDFVIKLLGGENTFTVTATRAKTGTVLSVNQNKIDDTNPSCLSGICP